MRAHNLKLLEEDMVKVAIIFNPISKQQLHLVKKEAKAARSLLDQLKQVSASREREAVRVTTVAKAYTR